MPNDEINPPAAYAALWTAVGVGAALAVLAWIGFSWWVGRERRDPENSAVPMVNPIDARAAALAEIARIRRDAAQGLSGRQAHQQLSRVVRDFVASVTGVPADRMTLQQLRSQPAAAQWTTLSQWVEVLHPPEFAPTSQRSLEQSCLEAERLVQQWH